jgi:DinB superfamily
VDEQERQSILAKLRETREAFLGAVQGVSEDQARWKPAPEIWSILECAEHVAVAERRMLDRLTKETKPLAGGAARPGREQEILAGGTDRSKKFKAPEGAAPAGRFAILAEALAAFDASRSETIAYIEGCGDDLRSRETMHPLFGSITARECLALLTIHSARHALQVREIREYPQFPR